MNIAFVAPSHKPIHTKTTGGVETFNLHFVNTLAELGHTVHFFAASETDASLLHPDVKLESIFSIDVFKKHDDNFDSKEFTINYLFFQQYFLLEALKKRDVFDIIHLSAAQWYIPFYYDIFSDTPLITTVHVNNLRPSVLESLLQIGKGTHIVNISESSGRGFEDYDQRTVIHNGIDISLFPFNKTPDNYFAWLGRISPVKGLYEALLASKNNDSILKASGSVDFQDYFDTKVKPLLDEKRTLVDPLNQNDKAVFMGKAKAMLMPVQWEEPFGLVAIESMATGTPVIAFKRGGLKEIVVDGVTGFLVETVEEMAEKMKEIDSIDREKCRAHVEKYFTTDRMVKTYVDTYDRLIQKQ